VVNLRGQILTAIHLAKRINLVECCQDDDKDEDGNKKEKRFHNVITGNKEEPVCLLVERIGDVMAVPVSQIEKAPDMLKGVDTRFVQNVCKLPSQLLIILDSAAIEAPDSTQKNIGEENRAA
jgi:purine-binding chemotaxis protein CheW